MTTLKLFEPQTTEDVVQALRERARAIAPLRGPEIEIELGELLLELKQHLNGEFPAFCRGLWPERRRPDDRAKRLMEKASVRRPTDTPHEQDPVAPTAGSAREAGVPEQSPPPAILGQRAATLYSRLAPLLGMGRHERRAAIIAMSAETGTPQRTLYRQLRRLETEGAQGLERKPRSDRGEISLPAEVRAAVVEMRTDVKTRDYPLTLTAQLLRERFPGVEISDWTVHYIDTRIPKVARMTPRELRIAHGPTGRWENGWPNHTHVVDMTWGDVFYWNGDPNVKPRRPRFTAVVDEFSSSIMFGFYHEGDAGRPELAAALLHAWLPKPEKGWIQHGFPDRLHMDNGKVQTSDWMEAVCRAERIELHLTTAYSPWQQGHVEAANRILHEDFEQRFSSAYCGRNAQSKPASFVEPDSVTPPKWAECYPTLEALNRKFRAWCAGDYHDRGLARCHNQSRREVWRLHVGDHLRLPRDAETTLHTALLQRADRGGTRIVNNGGVSNLAMRYEHDLLQQYDGNEVEVRWDPSDLSRVLVLQILGDDQFRPLCWAPRQSVFQVGNPADIKERSRQAAVKRRRDQEIKDAIHAAASLDRAGREQVIERIAETRTESGIIDFPRTAREIEPEEELDITALLEEEDVGAHGDAPTPTGPRPVTRSAAPAADPDDEVEIIPGLRI